MSLLDKLKKQKKVYETINKEQITNKINDRNKIFRFHYLYFNNYLISEMHDFCCDTFVIPDDWNNEDAFLF